MFYSWNALFILNMYLFLNRTSIEYFFFEKKEEAQISHEKSIHMKTIYDSFSIKFHTKKLEKWGWKIVEVAASHQKKYRLLFLVEHQRTIQLNTLYRMWVDRKRNLRAFKCEQIYSENVELEHERSRTMCFFYPATLARMLSTAVDNKENRTGFSSASVSFFLGTSEPSLMGDFRFGFQAHHETAVWLPN